MSVEEGIHLMPEVELSNVKSKSSSSHVLDEKARTSKFSEAIYVTKFIFELVWAVIKRYWYISIVVVILIITFICLFGFWSAFAIFLCTLLVIAYHMSDQLVFWPSYPSDARTNVAPSSSVGLPSENLYLYTKDGIKLHAIFIKQNESSLKRVATFIYLHGNAGNLGHRLRNVYDMYRYLEINIFMVEYRGYGFSEGYPTERGLYLDAQAAICYLRTRNDINTNRIFVFGRSLGGAVAVEIVSRSEIRSRVAGLIIENTFTSIPEMAKVMFSGFKILSLPSWCHKNKFSSKMKMCRIIVPTLFISGLADSLVPPKMMEELYHSCASPTKRLLKFPKGNHNETCRCKGYYMGFANFINEVFHYTGEPMPLPPGVTSISEPQIL